MYASRLYATLMAWRLLLASVTADDCPYKECDCAGTYINCNNRGFTAIPIRQDVEKGGYITLTFDTNNITEISDGSLPLGLTEISLLNNPITTIDDNAFDELSTTLESLYFTNARFERIPDAFLHLNGLRHLNIMETKIVDWNIGAMAHIGQTLETLNLENVGFTTWPVWTQFFSSLDELNIAGSTMTTIPENAFDRLTNSLSTLTLYNNSFTSVPKALSGLKYVFDLDLHGNQISNLTWLPQNKLSDLSLDHNNISDANHFSNVLRVYADSLMSVTISFNKLSVIPDLSFLPQIGILDLSHNLISDPHSGSLDSDVFEIDLSYNLLPSVPIVLLKLKRLTLVNIHHNVIEELRGEAIPPWSSDMDVSYNLITELTDTSFPINSSITGLNMNYNPILKVSSQAFANLPSLFWISLQNTKLARIPLSLVHLPKLSSIDLGNSPDLVCTCLDKDLEPMITSGKVDVSGNCGETSIYNFFATFSLTCQ